MAGHYLTDWPVQLQLCGLLKPLRLPILVTVSQNLSQNLKTEPASIQT
jgi:hypothetical protein